jgi:hypothetical protein
LVVPEQAAVVGWTNRTILPSLDPISVALDVLTVDHDLKETEEPSHVRGEA